MAQGGRSTSLLATAQRKALRDIVPQLMRAVQGVPKDILYGFEEFDQLPQGPSNLQNLSLAGLEQMAMGGGGGVGGFDQARKTAGQVADLSPEALDNYFNTNIKDPLMRSYERDVVPGIKRTGFGEGSLFSGGGNSGTGDRLGRADENLIRSLTEARADLGYEQQDRALTAAGLLGNLAGQESTLLGNLLSYGDTPRQIAEQQRQARLIEMARQNQIRNDRITQLIGATTTTTSGAVGQSGDSWLTALIQGLAGGYQSYNKTQQAPPNQPVSNLGRTRSTGTSNSSGQGSVTGSAGADAGAGGAAALMAILGGLGA